MAIDIQYSCRNNACKLVSAQVYCTLSGSRSDKAQHRTTSDASSTDDAQQLKNLSLNHNMSTHVRDCQISTSYRELLFWQTAGILGFRKRHV